jgi:hypothetical protein
MEEFRGIGRMIEVQPLSRPAGNVWPWIVAALGALIIVAGGVLFSPDGDVGLSAPPAISSE